jgi:circadian clock protein KaiC
MLTLRKSPTGVVGFDAITMGGLPTGRPSLVCGGPGSGKTLFALNFLVSGATVFDEPGVFLSFEGRPRIWRQTAPRLATTSTR